MAEGTEGDRGEGDRHESGRGEGGRHQGDRDEGDPGGSDGGGGEGDRGEESGGEWDGGGPGEGEWDGGDRTWSEAEAEMGAAVDDALEAELKRRRARFVQEIVGYDRMEGVGRADAHREDRLRRDVDPDRPDEPGV